MRVRQNTFSHCRERKLWTNDGLATSRHSDIIDMLPISLNSARGLCFFKPPIVGEKEQSRPPQLVASCNSILWVAGSSAAPFCMKKQSTLTKIKENILYLLGIVFFGFIYSIGILALLGMVLNWTLGINITEFDTSYRLVLLAWGLCAVGQHLYFKHDEERKIEAQLELLRQGRSVSYPRPTLMERWEKEKKNYEHTN